MESEEPGHEEYRYNIGPIEHDPFILISYLSAKYEEFTFEQVKPELDALFALHLTRCLCPLKGRLYYFDLTLKRVFIFFYT